MEGRVILVTLPVATSIVSRTTPSGPWATMARWVPSGDHDGSKLPPLTCPTWVIPDPPAFMT